MAEFVDRSVKIATDISKQTGGKLKDFRAALKDGEAAFPDLVALKKDVVSFARTFPTVGF